MEHPDKEKREQQAKFLEQLPEHMREEHARLFRFENASNLYYQMAKKFEPTENDFLEWLEGLPENAAQYVAKIGFEACKGSASFLRYMDEKNDIGMDEFMRLNLDEDDYREYKKGWTP